MNNVRPQKTVFLDRDGVINKCAAPHCYISKWEEFHFLPGAIEGIRSLNKAGYLVLIVSNQRGIARGLYTRKDVDELHEKMCNVLKENDAYIDGIYICPHDDRVCSCRKPLPGLFYQAENEWMIDKEHSWCIGDFESDILAGRDYGVKTILIGSPEKAYGQTGTFKNLKEAVNFLTAMEDRK